jgi:sulfoxide reductase heme-binding subunit YedZ
MLHDVRKRPFITVGFTGFVLMLPLALTSTAAWIRRLGGKRWLALHRLIYVTAIAGVVHYYWLVKSDVRKPLFYGSLLTLLLALRVGFWLVKRRDKPLGNALEPKLTTAETV